MVFQMSDTFPVNRDYHVGISKIIIWITFWMYTTHVCYESFFFVIQIQFNKGPKWLHYTQMGIQDIDLYSSSSAWWVASVIMLLQQNVSLCVQTPLHVMLQGCLESFLIAFLYLPTNLSSCFDTVIAI